VDDLTCQTVEWLPGGLESCHQSADGSRKFDRRLAPGHAIPHRPGIGAAVHERRPARGSIEGLSLDHMADLYDYLDVPE
jgi:hypothetical protein